MALLMSCGAAPHSVNYTKVRMLGTPAHVVTVNLNDPEVRVSVAMARSSAGCETFRSVLRRTRPAAAITGTYFATDSFWPVGDIVVDGQWLNHGLVGTALAITADNHAEFIETRHRPDRNWRAYTTVLCGGPRLLTHGRVTVGPRWEGFYDRSLLALLPRTAVGITKRGKLLMVAVKKPIHLTRLAWIMRRLGARDAINLDGGSSTAMFYRGALLSRPARSLTNLLVVYDTPEAFARKLPDLAPGRLALGRPAAAQIFDELPCEKLDLTPGVGVVQ